MKAIWNDVVIAESDDTVLVEGNHYFPHTSVNSEYLQSSDQHTTCPWKGVASYYDVAVNGKVNYGAAWFYHTPSQAASNIKDMVAFWRGVKIAE